MKAEEMSHNIVRDALDIVDSGKCQDEEVNLLRERLQSRLDPNYPDALKIGLVGDSGAGLLFAPCWVLAYR